MAISNIQTDRLPSNITVSGNVTANIFVGNGAGLTSISGGGGNGIPGGANTQIQYNHSNTFAGDANLSWNYTTLTVGNSSVNVAANSTSLMVGNVGGSITVNTATIIVGNSTVNTVITAYGIQTYANTYANLPSSPSLGMSMVVTDANVTTFGSTVSVGGNSHVVRVLYNGSAWVIG